MRITYVCTDPGVPVFGTKGASVHVQELVRAYRRLGHRVRLVAARTGGPPPADLADVEVVDAGRPQAADPARREVEARVLDARLESALSAGGVGELVHERYSLWGGAGVRAGARRGVPSVLEVNAPLIEEQARHRGLVGRDAAHDHLARTLGAARVAVAVSDPVGRWVEGHAEGSTPVAVVPNGVDVARVTPGDDRDPARLTVGFVGSLKPWHGTEVLVDAVAALGPALPAGAPRPRLLLVGHGPERDAVVARARAAGVDVEQVGPLRPEDVPAQLHRMDVACAPYPEGADYFSPLKVLEYMAAGLPVVASDVGQVRTLLDDGRCGVLVHPGDPLALAAALLGLAGDPDGAAALGRRARQAVEARHDWTDVARRTLAAAGVGDHHPVGTGAR